MVRRIALRAAHGTPHNTIPGSSPRMTAVAEAYAAATRARSAVIRSATFSRSSAVGQSPDTTIF